MLFSFSSDLPNWTAGAAREQFVAPFVLPKLPSRVYVRFGEPVSLEGLDKRDRDSCQEVYERVKVRPTMVIYVVWRLQEERQARRDLDSFGSKVVQYSFCLCEQCYR